MPLDLTREELELLDELLHQKLIDLRVEIHRTDSRKFAEALRQREDVLSSIVAKIDAQGLHGTQPVEPAAARSESKV